jgi:hypothetical protein
MVAPVICNVLGCCRIGRAEFAERKRKQAMKRFCSAGALICLAAAGVASAADDGVAFYGELYGGSLDSDTAVAGYGALTLPIQQQFGAHVEVLADKVGDDNTQNIGGHLYWRDPNKGLLGLIASYTDFDIGGFEGDFTGYGVEGELYLAPFAIAAQYAWLDSDDATLDDEQYLAVDVHWDSQGSWYAFGGLRSLADEDVGFAEVDFTPDGGRSPFTVYGGLTFNDYESQYLGLDYVVRSTASSDLSVFVEVDNGEGDFDGFFVGITYGAGPVNRAPLISLFEPVKGGF